MLGAGGVVRAINAGTREVPRKELDELTDVAKRYGAGGLVWAFVQDDGTWRSPIAKFLSADEIAAVTAALDAQPGDLLLAVADTADTAAAALGALRLELARAGTSCPHGRHDVLWVVDFPMFERNEAEARWDALHHPFTAPTGDLDGDPGSLRSRAYDLVVDGWELGGGSIRIHDPAVQSRVLEIIGMDADGGRGALRLPARGAALRRAAARRHRVRHRPHRRAAGRPRLDPRRDRVPEDRQRLGPADRRAGARRRRAAARARAARRCRRRARVGTGGPPELTAPA